MTQAEINTYSGRNINRHAVNLVGPVPPVPHCVLCRTAQQANSFGYLGMVLFGAIGGAFVPLDLLPGWARAIAPASPGYWAMHAMRAAFTGDVRAALVGWLALAGFAIAAAALGGCRLRRGWGRGTPG